MFWRMIRGSLFRQWKKMAMIAFTIMLGASLATAMLSVMMDVGDKINEELRTYGANITVAPRENSVIDSLYDVEGETNTGAYLQEDELPKIKTIFWAFNILDYAPFVTTTAGLRDGISVEVVGSWFNHHLELPTGETLDAGINSLRSWWDIQGDWIDEQDAQSDHEAMVGAALAAKENIAVGDTVHVMGYAQSADLTVVGIFDAGGEEDDQIYTTLSTAQLLGGLEGKVDSIEVSALTTPDNELAELAAKDPSALSVDQYETWYCTAYASSICYQIQEVITDSVASPVRQVADSEGAIMEKTQLLMVLITILALIGSALGIMNLVTESVMERKREIGLMKAVGAHSRSITGLILTEILITAVIGGAIGYFAGFGLAQVIGQSVFGAAITMRAMVVPVVALLVIAVAMVGSFPAIRAIAKMDPTVVLHAR